MSREIPFKQTSNLSSQSASGALSQAPGVSGDVFSLSPSSTSKIVKLTSLFSSGLESGVTLTVGGRDVFTNLGLGGDFNVGVVGSSGVLTNPEGIQGGEGEAITLKKLAGNTTTTITWAFEEVG